MLITRVIRPSYGEVCVYEHEFSNPFSSEMVFEIRVSDERELSVLRRMDEYRALRAANARFFGTPSQPVGSLEEEVMAGNRIYLQVSPEKKEGHNKQVEIGEPEPWKGSQ